jgi:hypothetical protein
MDSGDGVRKHFGRSSQLGVQRMTKRSESRAFGVLNTFSPEMAKELGEAFSLARIGSGKAPQDSGTAREVLRFAGRVAVFLLIAVVAVSLTVTAMYLMPFP